jgi:hypothetical protein
MLLQFDLKLPNLTADNRLGNVQYSRRLGETSELGHPYETFELF